MTRRKVSAEEEELLAHAMKGVKPAPRRAAKKAKPAPPVAAKKSAKPAVQSPPPPPVKKPKPAPPLVSVDKRTEQKLKRGRIEIGSTIDLHGLKQTEAHKVLRSFIARAATDGHKAVLVITGKGSATRARDDGFMPGDRSGVLKAQVPIWLEEPGLRSFVLSFKAAGPRHGGAGALYVMLRKPKAR